MFRVLRYATEGVTAARPESGGPPKRSFNSIGGRSVMDEVLLHTICIETRHGKRIQPQERVLLGKKSLVPCSNCALDRLVAAVCALPERRTAEGSRLSGGRGGNG